MRSQKMIVLLRLSSRLMWSCLGFIPSVLGLPDCLELVLREGLGFPVGDGRVEQLEVAAFFCQLISLFVKL